VVKAWNDHKPWPRCGKARRPLLPDCACQAYADYIILDILSRAAGRPFAVSDAQIFQAVQNWASREGIFASPEGAASLAAYKLLLEQKFLKPTDKVVLFNTGSGLKYIDVIAQALKISV